MCVCCGARQSAVHEMCVAELAAWYNNACIVSWGDSCNLIRWSLGCVVESCTNMHTHWACEITAQAQRKSGHLRGHASWPLNLNIYVYVCVSVCPRLCVCSAKTMWPSFKLGTPGVTKLTPGSCRDGEQMSPVDLCVCVACTLYSCVCLCISGSWCPNV